MLNKRLIAILTVVALLAAVAFTIKMDTASPAVAHNGLEVSDYFQRHPTGLNLGVAGYTDDYFQRHPIWLNLGVAEYANDYIQRHANSFKPANAVDLSDWFQRHPGSIGR
jgi:hypothetical protein